MSHACQKLKGTLKPIINETRTTTRTNDGADCAEVFVYVSVYIKVCVPHPHYNEILWLLVLPFGIVFCPQKWNISFCKRIFLLTSVKFIACEMYFISSFPHER